jgi:hydrogenase nickel incorporation protein HypA/HybF
MHEVGLIQNTLELAIEQAKRSKASRIHAIRMRVGALSGVESEALEFAFDVVTQGTMAAGAKLEVERVSVICHCSHCDQEFEPAGFLYECPHCHAMDVAVRRGRELELMSLEVS